MRVLSMIATFTEVSKIVEKVKEEFNIVITKDAINAYKYSERYKGDIAKIRERWSVDIFDVELANKKRRLQELERIYKHSYETDQMKNALGALYQIQGEVEKNLQNIGSQTNYQINIYKDMTEAELEEERLKSFERLKILKGEIADASDVREAEKIDGIGVQPS